MNVITERKCNTVREKNDIRGNTFCVRYSTRGTARCKKCKKMIIKGEIQMGKLVPFKTKYIFHNYHAHCLFETFQKAKLAKHVFLSLDEVDGVDCIRKDDKELIDQLLANFLASQNKPLPQEQKRVNRRVKLPYLEEVKSVRPKLKPTTVPSVKIMVTNADQMTSIKKIELLKRIEIERPMIVAISEVKSKQRTRTVDGNIPNYTLHPVNLTNNIGRGIAVYTHTSIDKSVIQIKSKIEYEEACLLEVRLRHGDTLLFGCLYRSPTPSSTSDANNTHLIDLLKSISNKKYSHVCIVGDFNYKKINWKTWTSPGSENSPECAFIEGVRDCFLHQHVVNPTRRRGDDEPSLLDLVLTNEPMQVSNLKHKAPLDKSDHDVILFDFHCYLNYTKPKEKWLFSRGDFDGMRRKINDEHWNIDFLTLASQLASTSMCSRVEQCWEILKGKIIELRNEFIPKITVSNKPSWREKGSFPIDQAAREAVRNKDRKHRKWISSLLFNDENNARLEYTKARNKAKTMLRQAKRRYEKSIALQSKENPKCFWAYTRSKMKSKSGISPLLSDPKDDTSLMFDDQDKANILQDQFLSVFTNECSTNIPLLPSRTSAIVNNIHVTEDNVLKLLKELNVNKSVGPDEMHPKMLTEISDVIAGPIAILFNMTIKDGELPTDWKKAYVSPIFKKGVRNLAVNYRPISLTSIICKVMEKIIRHVIMDHLINENLLSDNQHGFISGRSTTTQLLTFLDTCVRSIVEGNVVDVIYLDFWKAFDTVPHHRLLGKLKAYGIIGNLLQWIKSFLVGRTQEVVVNGSLSKCGCVASGIPQGSVLGPLLFVIFINDILEGIKSNGLMYADDTKIFRMISTKEDAEKLQKDIEMLESWSSKWDLKFHPDKCHVLTLGNFENIRYTSRYMICDKEMEHVSSEKDLGIIIDENLNFEEHISNKVRIANAIVGQIRSSFTFLDGTTFKRLYTTFVRPHLEYAQTVWSPYLQKHINMLENVQDRATKLVDGIGVLEYAERLRKLELPSLKYRRKRGDMIEIFKHFNSYDRRSLSPSFQPRIRTSRAHKLQINDRIPKDGCRGIQSNGFYYRTARIWNTLPAKVAEAKSINSFKANLDEHWKDIKYI